MSFIAQIRRGSGPYWGALKRLAKALLAMHLPTGGLLRPLWRVLFLVHVSIRELWVWSRRFLWNEPLFRSQCESIGRGFCMEELPYLGGAGRIVIGDNVRFSGIISIGFNNRAMVAPEFIIGAGTFIGHRAGFNIASSIRIGRNCYIASAVSIIDMDGHPIDAVARRNGMPTPISGISPVTVGNDVWIGFHAIVLKGVTIGDRAIVAAGAVVTKDVPEDTIVAGNPARIVRRLVDDADVRAPSELVTHSRALLNADFTS